MDLLTAWANKEVNEGSSPFKEIEMKNNETKEEEIRFIPINGQRSSGDQGKASLHNAVFNREPNRVLCLLNAGADPSQSIKDNDRSPWELALEWRDDPEMIGILAQHQAIDINHQGAPFPNDWTALHLTVSCGNIKNAIKLLKLGANWNQKDRENRTCLDIAVQYNANCPQLWLKLAEYIKHMEQGI